MEPILSIGDWFYESGLSRGPKHRVDLEQLYKQYGLYLQAERENRLRMGGGMSPWQVYTAERHALKDQQHETERKEDLALAKTKYDEAQEWRRKVDARAEKAAINSQELSWIAILRGRSDRAAKRAYDYENDSPPDYTEARLAELLQEKTDFDEAYLEAVEKLEAKHGAATTGPAIPQIPMPPKRTAQATQEAPRTVLERLQRQYPDGRMPPGATKELEDAKRALGWIE